MSDGWLLIAALHVFVGLIVYLWIAQAERHDTPKILERPAKIAAHWDFGILLFLIFWPLWLLIYLFRKGTRSPDG